MTRIEFTELMSRLRARYQNAISDADMWLLSIDEYWSACKDYEPEAIRLVFARAHQVHRDWMPSLGQLEELLHQGLSGSEAWQEVLVLAAMSGDDHSDPVAAEAMREMGGGKHFGSLKTNELQWAKREFLALYDQIKNRATVAPKTTKALPEPEEVSKLEDWDPDLVDPNNEYAGMSAAEVRDAVRARLSLG